MSNYVILNSDSNLKDIKFYSLKFKYWSKKVLRELNLNRKIVSIIFISETEIKNINKEYRNKDSVTDVLSFSQVEGFNPVNNPDKELLGDILICYNYAIESINFLKPEMAIKFLILHGILHLIGHDHESDNGEMNDIQTKLFKKLTGVEVY